MFFEKLNFYFEKKNTFCAHFLEKNVKKTFFHLLTHIFSILFQKKGEHIYFFYFFFKNVF